MQPEVTIKVEYRESKTLLHARTLKEMVAVAEAENNALHGEVAMKS